MQLASGIVLAPEKVGDEDGGDGAGDVGEQGVACRVAGLHHSYGTEVDGEDIECSVCAPPYHGSQTAYEGVSSFGLHHVEHHGAAAAAAKRLHKHRR